MKIGLKTYITNIGYILPAKTLFAAGAFDYIEIFLVPGKSKTGISQWIETGIPLAFHAPHSYGGFNPSIKERWQENKKIMQEIADVCSSHLPQYLVFHPGINGTLNETIRQFSNLLDLYPQLKSFALIENKPFVGMLGEQCLGSTPDEIRFVCENTGLGFCLDFGHAACAAVSHKLEWKNYIEQFLKLNPSAFHLSDGHITSVHDEHLHFGKGDYNIPWFISKIGKNHTVAIETEKSSKDSLNDFLEDTVYINELVKKEV